MSVSEFAAGLPFWLFFAILVLVAALLGVVGFSFVGGALWGAAWWALRVLGTKSRAA